MKTIILVLLVSAAVSADVGLHSTAIVQVDRAGNNVAYSIHERASLPTGAHVDGQQDIPVTPYRTPGAGLLPDSPPLYHQGHHYVSSYHSGRYNGYPYLSGRSNFVPIGYNGAVNGPPLNYLHGTNLPVDQEDIPI